MRNATSSPICGSPGSAYARSGSGLGVNHTTVGRELTRNGPPEAPWPYWYEDGQARGDARRHTARSARRQRHRPLVDYVVRKLRVDWSPEQIPAKLALEHPDEPAMRVSIETLYRWVYLDARRGGTLYTHLRRRRKGRRRQKRYGAGRRVLVDRVGIEARPALVGARPRFGDWEGDTLGTRSPLATHVERKSRYLLAGKLTDPRRPHAPRGMAARHQRKHERPPAPIFPEGDRFRPSARPGSPGGD